MKKLLYAVTLALCGIVSSPSAVAAEYSSASKAESTQSLPYLPAQIQQGVILHCFVWPLREITAELPNIARAGFCAVQLSPMQAPNVAGQPWYYTYGPCDYRFYDNVLGTRDDLRELCAKADALGIKVIMDIAPNHLFDDTDKSPFRAPEQYTNRWWFEEGRCKTRAQQGEVKWNSRWSFTHENIFGCEIQTDRADVQQRMREYLDDLYSMGVRGVRWDSGKHIGVPSEGDDFWKNVLEGRENMWTYGEILGDIDYAPHLISEYVKYMSVTDSWFDWHSSKHYLSHAGVPRNKCVLWAESHDTYSNDEIGSRALSQEEIDRIWAMTASRVGASALYFSRPAPLPKDSIKLAVKGSTHFTSPEVAEVNKFHNIMAGLPEEVRCENYFSAVYRKRGVVIVADKAGKISIPAGHLATDIAYTDHITGNTFTLSGGQLSGEVGPGRIAVVYDMKATHPYLSMSISPDKLSFFEDTAIYTLTTSGTDKGAYSLDGHTYTSFSNSTDIMVGEGVPYGKTITIYWKAGEGDITVSGSFVLHKEELLNNHVYMRSDKDFSGMNTFCFIYTEGGNTNAGWPGQGMTYDSGITVNGKTGWYAYAIPVELAREGLAMVSTSGIYRYPADGVPGIPLEGKSLAFEYTGGKWTTSRVESTVGIDLPTMTESDTPVRYFTVTGQILPGRPTTPGIYIAVKGNEATRILLR